MLYMITETKVTTWGNSLGIRIGRRDALRAGISRGSLVRIRAQPGKITVVQTHSSQDAKSIPRYSLKKLLRGVTPKNLNRDQEFLDAPPIGREVI